MKKFFIGLLIVVFVVLAGIFLFINYGVYSEGTRAGQVIKVSKKGVVFKTWEGQLNMQSFGAVKSDNSMAEVFTFSVKKGDTAIYNVLQNVSLTGERVNLHYEQKYAKIPWKGDSKFFIVKIDRLKESQNNKQKDNDPYREGR